MPSRGSEASRGGGWWGQQSECRVQTGWRLLRAEVEASAGKGWEQGGRGAGLGCGGGVLATGRGEGSTAGVVG